MSRHLVRHRTKQTMHRRATRSTWLHNGTWVINGVNLINTPTLGSEILADPGIENWTNSTTPTTWTKSTAGSSTVNQETSVIHGGSNAVRVDIDSGNSSAHINVLISGSVSIGDWFMMTGWVKCSTTGKSFRFDQDATSGATQIPSTTYAQFYQGARRGSSDSRVFLFRASAASSSLYFDDISVKKLTLNTLFAVKASRANPGYVSAAGTITAGNPCGVVYGLDSYSSPATFLIAYHDGISTLSFVKCVSGTYTSLISTGVTYVSGQLPQIRWTGSTTYQLWYNGSQRGSNQTVSDAGTGIYHGVFSASPLNTITAFLAQ